MQPDRRRKPRVLVVDDKAANHLALAAVLENECEMLFAASGAEALKVLQAQPSVDVVRNREAHQGDRGAARVPVVFVTAVTSASPSIPRFFA
jgi:response regulator RpfG family c-di-GMP phosphodiesterase